LSTRVALAERVHTEYFCIVKNIVGNAMRALKEILNEVFRRLLYTPFSVVNFFDAVAVVRAGNEL